MQRVRAGMFLAALFALAGPSISAQVPSDLQQAINARQKALDTGDISAWDRLTAGDFTQVDQMGRLRTKAERIAQMKQQKPTAAAASEQQVRVYGDTAIQRLRNGNSRVLQVWMKSAQGWQVIATQLTSIAQ